jgi:hypothetical protein
VNISATTTRFCGLSGGIFVSGGVPVVVGWIVGSGSGGSEDVGGKVVVGSKVVGAGVGLVEVVGEGVVRVGVGVTVVLAGAGVVTGIVVEKVGVVTNVGVVDMILVGVIVGSGVVTATGWVEGRGVGNNTVTEGGTAIVSGTVMLGKVLMGNAVMAALPTSGGYVVGRNNMLIPAISQPEIDKTRIERPARVSCFFQNLFFIRIAYSIIQNTNILCLARLPKKRCRTLPAEGLGVYPQTNNPPKIGGLGIE